jgi:hypothetical protein
VVSVLRRRLRDMRIKNNARFGKGESASYGVFVACEVAHSRRDDRVRNTNGNVTIARMSISLKLSM